MNGRKTDTCGSTSADGPNWSSPYGSRSPKRSMRRSSWTALNSYGVNRWFLKSARANANAAFGISAFYD